MRPSRLQTLLVILATLVAPATLSGVAAANFSQASLCEHGTGCPRPRPAPTAAPQISGFRAAPRRFRVPAGTDLKLVLSAPGTVAFEVEQKPACDPAHTCPVYVAVQEFTRALPAGPSSLAYSGRYRQGGKVRSLTPGRYRVTAVPRGTSGTEGAQRAAALAVVR
jgi:hypothetical protein